MYECFHCGARAVVWDADFTPEEYGYEEDGVVHCLTCQNCGAEIIYIVLQKEDDE